MALIPYATESGPFIERAGTFGTRLHVDPETGHGCFLPAPPLEALDQFYNSNPQHAAQLVQSGTLYTLEILPVLQRVKSIMQEVGGLGEGFRFHDAGCGFGVGVWAMLQLGVYATGNDINRAGVMAANGPCLGQLYPGTLAEAASTFAEPIDGFFSAHVLQGLPDPEVELRLFAKHLSPRGMAYICLPNAANERALHGGRRANPHYALPHNLHHFTPLSLLRMAEAAGLKVIQMCTRSVLGGLLPETEADPARKQAAMDAMLGGEINIWAVRADNAHAPTDPSIEERALTAHAAFNAA